MILKHPAALNWKYHNLWSHGDLALIREPLSAVLCSNACPGAKILEAIDLAQQWRSENRAVISGFHTAVERECLRTFLRGPQHIVICPARGIDPFQLPGDWQPKFKRGELLIVSPFNSSIHRPTKETAEARTRLVLDLATDYTIIHASPNGSLSKLQAATRNAAL
jgi:predicted Rossmann fold nucleotide-binding protein DprA/Smf involved in DNA uptake